MEFIGMKITKQKSLLVFLLFAAVFFALPGKKAQAEIVTNETQITSENADVDSYDISIYDKVIVWVDSRNGNDDIYMYDISTQEETQVTNDSYYQMSPSIYDDKIVWESWYQGNVNIYMYAISTQEETQITNNNESFYADIYRDRIVWVEGRSSGSSWLYDIFMYNISTQETTQVTNSGHVAGFVQIYGDRIVWTDYRNEFSDIYMYDLTTSEETKITNGTSAQSYWPQIYGNKIVWQDDRNGMYDIYMYDISTQEETQITDKDNEDDNQYDGPRIYDDKIVWYSDYNDSSMDIYIYDISTQEAILVTDDNYPQYRPEIYEDEIIWTDYRNNERNIFLGVLDRVPSAPTADPDAGTYSETQWVELSSDEDSDFIMYDTTEMPADCESGTLYESAIEVAISETIYVMACDNDGNSANASFEYIIPTVEFSSATASFDEDEEIPEGVLPSSTPDYDSTISGDDNQLYFPVGVATDSQGNIYVTDFNQSEEEPDARVQKFDSSGTFIKSIGSFGTEDGQFAVPVGIVTDSDDNIYVTDIATYRIQKLSSEGVHIATWGSQGTGDGQFGENDMPMFGITIDSSDNVYVTDPGNGRIQKFDSDGEYLSNFGSSGTGNGQFGEMLTGITTDSQDNIYVSDSENYRVQKFDSDGEYLSNFGSSGTNDGQFQGIITDVAIDSVNNVYVTEVGGEEISRVQKFSSNGTFLAEWGTPGTGNENFMMPYGMAIDSSDNFYVADTFNNRVQKFVYSASYTTNARFELSLSETSTEDVTVDYAVMGGTATGGGVDYALASGTATIPAGEASVIVEYSILDDAIYEGDETIEITLSNPENATLGDVDEQTVTIVDNDEEEPNVQFVSSSSSGSESVTNVNIPVVLSGTPSGNDDGETLLWWRADNDGENPIIEEPEDYNPLGFEYHGIYPDSSSIDLTKRMVGNGSLRCNTKENGTEPREYYLRSDTLSNAEGRFGFWIYNENGGTISVKLFNPENDDYFTISFRENEDITFYASGFESFPVQAPFINYQISSDAWYFIEVALFDDGNFEAYVDGVKFDLYDYQLFTPGIRFNRIMMSNNMSGVTEDEVFYFDNIIFHSNPNASLYEYRDFDEYTPITSSSEDVTVDYAVTGGTATGDGTDYTLASGTLTIPSGDTTVNIPLTIINDSDDEDNETIEITLSNSSGATLGINTVHTYTITDDEEEPVDNSNQEYPAIYEDRYVWQDDRNGEADIYMYDIATEEETRITDEIIRQEHPKIYEDRIVWQDYRNGNYDIYMYDISEQEETRITTGATDQYNPSIYGDVIVYSDYDNSDYDIYMYNISTEEETQITNEGSAQQVYPSIYDDKIVWMDNRNGNWDIYMYDIASQEETRITDESINQEYSDIYDDKIVWLDERDNSDSLWDIYMYDLSTLTETRITSIDTAMMPAIYDNVIVWQDNRFSGDNNWHIYRYNLLTLTETRIDANSSDQEYPDIYGNRIVWQDDRDGSWKIYSATFEDEEPETPTIQFSATSSSNQENITGANVELSLSENLALDVTVDYAVTGGSATGDGTDYTLESGTLTIPSGSTTANIPLTIIDDLLEESNETIEITLSNPTNVDLGNNTVHTYTIIDNDGEEDEPEELKITDVEYSSTQTEINITWKTNRDANSTVFYGLDKNLKDKEENDRREKKHEMTLTNLTSNTKYYFRIKSEDKDGISDRTKIYSISTKPEICENFTYSDWGECQENNTQTRTITSREPKDCTGGNPEDLTRDCTHILPPITCTSFTYSDWGICQENNTQSRTITFQLPPDCTGGNPENLTQSCLNKEEDQIIPKEEPINKTKETITKFTKIPTIEIATLSSIITGILATATLPLAASTSTSTGVALAGNMLKALFGKRSKKQWGLVFDSKTKTPIDFATVAIYNTDGNIVDKTLTDKDGRFGFLAVAGSYQLKVFKDRFTFPSKISGEEQDEIYGKTYNGETIQVTEDQVLKLNIPVDAQFDLMQLAGKRIKRFTSIGGVIGKFALNAMFVIGFLLAIFTQIFNPSNLNLIFLAIYTIFVIHHIFFKKKNFGLLIDSQTKQPIPFARINISKDDFSNAKVDFALTDMYGRFFKLLENGYYLLNIKGTTLDQRLFSEKRNVRVSKGILNEKIRM